MEREYVKMTLSIVGIIHSLKVFIYSFIHSYGWTTQFANYLGKQAAFGIRFQHFRISGIRIHKPFRKLIWLNYRVR